MMSGLPLETCWAFNKHWNNKFYYKVTSCWLFLLIHTTMHESMNIKSPLNLVGQPLGRDCCPYSSWRLRRRPGYVEKIKLVWRWVILNSLFRFCIWYTVRLPNVIYDASKSWCGSRIRRNPINFQYVGLFFYLLSCVESSLYVLFWQSLLYITQTVIFCCGR
jgi:hypothetical protein